MLPNWSGETVFCLATGPSLTADDVSAVRGHGRVIAVSDNYRLAPWADVVYAADARWWEHHRGVPEFTGLKIALESSRRMAGWPDIRLLHRAKPGIVLSRDPSALAGRNSGHQALNLAVLCGAKRIVLLGYDMQRNGEHWFGRHAFSHSGHNFPGWLQQFRDAVVPLHRLGVSVVNCTRKTSLTCFPQMPLERVLMQVAA